MFSLAISTSKSRLALFHTTKYAVVQAQIVSVDYVVEEEIINLLR